MLDEILGRRLGVISGFEHHPEFPHRLMGGSRIDARYWIAENGDAAECVVTTYPTHVQHNKVAVLAARAAVALPDLSTLRIDCIDEHCREFAFYGIKRQAELLTLTPEYCLEVRWPPEVRLGSFNRVRECQMI